MTNAAQKPKLYFRNTVTGKRYQIISLDKKAGTIVLKGDHAEFTETYDKTRFAEMGYVLEKDEA